MVSAGDLINAAQLAILNESVKELKHNIAGLNEELRVLNMQTGKANALFTSMELSSKRMEWLTWAIAILTGVLFVFGCVHFAIALKFI